MTQAISPAPSAQTAALAMDAILGDREEIVFSEPQFIAAMPPGFVEPTDFKESRELAYEARHLGISYWHDYRWKPTRVSLRRLEMPPNRPTKTTTSVQVSAAPVPTLPVAAAAVPTAPRPVPAPSKAWVDPRILELQRVAALAPPPRPAPVIPVPAPRPQLPAPTPEELASEGRHVQSLLRKHWHVAIPISEAIQLVLLRSHGPKQLPNDDTQNMVVTRLSQIAVAECALRGGSLDLGAAIRAVHKEFHLAPQGD